MKKNLTISGLFILSFLLLFSGCQKEIKDKPVNSEIETESQSKSDHGGHGKECRLVSYTSEFGEDSYKYNHRGLLDEWEISDYGLFKQEYNARGRLVKSRLYTEGVLVNTIIFFYRNDQVIKEIWYNGSTEEKTDEVFYSYNRNGLIKKSESFMGDYYTIYKHSPQGNVLEWNFYLAGSLFYTGQNTYHHRHKNPYLAVPGLDYGFPYINAGMFQNKWYSSSEKVVYYDEEGNPQVIYDQDPLKTIVQFNGNNYVTASDFFDVLTQDYFHFRFDYENCDSRHENGGSDHKTDAQSVQKLPVANASRKNPLKLLKHGSAKSIKEQVKELRKQYLNKQ